MSRRDVGFSLLEMALVLVVVGLVLAGIAAGGQLMKQAELRTLASQVTGVNSALQDFHASI